MRLSLESAKRLRWIESEDVSALVRRHAQEKNLMGECVSAMRKFLLNKGFEVSSNNIPGALAPPLALSAVSCFHSLGIHFNIHET